MPFNYGYKILYTKRSKKGGKHRIVICTYSVPREGGSFSFNNGSMERFPLLGEFSYMKMIGTMIIFRLNEILKTTKNFKLAIGPLQNEYANIVMARNCFSASNRNYHTFISNYNNQNSASLVAYNVGLHNDTFKKHKESLENKIVLTFPGKKGTGRGGSSFRFKNNAIFCYAILDCTAPTANHPALQRAGVKGNRMTQTNIQTLFENSRPLYNALMRHEAIFSTGHRKNGCQQNTNTDTTQTTTTRTTTQPSTSAENNVQTSTTNRVTWQRTRNETNTPPSTSARVTRQRTRTDTAQREEEPRNDENRRWRISTPTTPYEQLNLLIPATEQYMTPEMYRTENRMTNGESRI